MRRTGLWQWLRDHLYLVDGSVAALTVLLGLFGMQTTEFRDIPLRGPDGWALLLNLAVTVPVAVRRRFPVSVGLVVCAAYFVQSYADYNSAAGAITVMLVTYTLGAHARAVPGLLIVLAEAVSSVVYVLVKPEISAASGLELSLPELTLVVIQFPGAWVIGRAMRARREYLVELEDRAERLERTSEAEVRAALAEERARVARELHDVVAHHVSVMTVQAAAARRTLQRDPERSVEAMRAVETTGRSALDEMRRIVGALRTADESEPTDVDTGRAPQAGVAELDTLLDRARDAGLHVDLFIVGTARPLPPSVDLAVYRVTQEALTNTLKHAGPTVARVRLRYEPAAVALTITDDGVDEARPRHRPDRAPRRSGHGLVGMRERISLNGGTLRTGTRTLGGFEVSAWLPFEPTEPNTQPNTDSEPNPEARTS